MNIINEKQKILNQTLRDVNKSFDFTKNNQ